MKTEEHHSSSSFSSIQILLAISFRIFVENFEKKCNSIPLVSITLEQSQNWHFWEILPSEILLDIYVPNIKWIHTSLKHEMLV